MTGEEKLLANGAGVGETDSFLMALIVQRNEQAMARLFDRHAKLVYSVALRVLRNKDMAEDILQEVFMQIWRAPVKVAEGAGSVAPLLAVMSRNRSIDLIRVGKRADFADDVPIVSHKDSAKDSERRLLLDRVRATVAEFPVDQRHVLELAFFEGMTHAEIAEATGSPLGTVKTRIRSALQQLGEAFKA